MKFEKRDFAVFGIGAMSVVAVALGMKSCGDTNDLKDEFAAGKKQLTEKIDSVSSQTSYVDSLLTTSIAGLTRLVRAHDNRICTLEGDVGELMERVDTLDDRVDSIAKHVCKCDRPKTPVRKNNPDNGGANNSDKNSNADRGNGRTAVTVVEHTPVVHEEHIVFICEDDRPVVPGKSNVQNVTVNGVGDANCEGANSQNISVIGHESGDNKVGLSTERAGTQNVSVIGNNSNNNTVTITNNTIRKDTIVHVNVQCTRTIVREKVRCR